MELISEIETLDFKVKEKVAKKCAKVKTDHDYYGAKIQEVLLEMLKHQQATG